MNNDRDTSVDIRMACMYMKNNNINMKKRFQSVPRRELNYATQQFFFEILRLVFRKQN